MFIGADHEVTGSCHYLQIGSVHLLVDCGMEQGRDTFENAELPVNAGEIDAVLLTHAHVDHSGHLPLLYARGFRGHIYTTRATADLCSIMLRDCAHIQQQEAEWRSRKGKRNAEIRQVEPIYTMEDAIRTIECIVPCDYDTRIELTPDISIRFTDIGHLLGSASIEVWGRENGEERKIVFSGDIGNENQPLIRDPRPTELADYCVMESTYGDRLHSSERPDYVEELSQILDRTFARGGNVVIPSFAVGRTQELLFFIRQIKKEGRVTSVPDFQVFVDSPLAVEATGIFEDHRYDCFDDEAAKLVKAHINPLSFPGLTLAISTEESRAINDDPDPKVIISASGMCEAGRIRHHLKHNLWDARNTILFVGYQSVGTTGRAIVDGADTVKLFGETVDVRAEIARLTGLSGHADRDGLLKWVHSFKERPRRIFVVHGEDSVCEGFAGLLRDEGYEASAPYSGSEFDLITDTWIREAVPVPVRKKITSAISDVYARLKRAGERLMSLIAKSEGLANKDKARLADQITALCDKWEGK